MSDTGNLTVNILGSGGDSAIINTNMVESSNVTANVVTGAKGDKGNTGDTGPAGADAPSDHTLLTNIGTNTHAQIDTAISNSVSHIANTSNPHSVTKAQVGLSNVPDTDFTADVAANTAKISFDAVSSARLANTSGTNTGDQDLSAYQLEPSEGAFIDGDKTKLDGIEALADVTDATNVASAGAIMDGDITGNGLMTRTGAGAYTNRTITGTTNQVTVTNGDGVSGNPTLSLPQNIHTGASPTFAGLGLTGEISQTKTTINNTFVNTSTNLNSQSGIRLSSSASTLGNYGGVNIATVIKDAGATTNRFVIDAVSYTGAYVKGLLHIQLDTNATTIFTNFSPTTDSTYTLGTSSLYWSNTYTDRLYLNSSAYLDGGTAGRIMLSGISQFQNANATIEYTTDHMSINKEASGNVYLFETGSIGNTADGKEFRIYRNAPEGTDYITMKVDQYRNAFISSNAGLLFRTASILGMVFDGNGGNIAFRDETFTDYITMERTTRNLLMKKGNIVFSEGGNIAVGTTTGTKIGTSTLAKLGFFNATPVVQPASTPANATDLATALTLVNDLKSKLVTLGLIA